MSVNKMQDRRDFRFHIEFVCDLSTIKRLGYEKILFNIDF